MDTRIKKLFQALMDNGWALKVPMHLMNDWWIFDIYEFRSEWSPVNKIILVTLLIDPQILKHKYSYTDIWAVGLSEIIPTEKSDECMAIQSLNDLSKGGLKYLVDKANEIRLKEF